MVFLGSKVGKIQTKFLHRDAVWLDIMKYLRLSNFHNCLINKHSTTFQSCCKLKLCRFLHFRGKMPKYGDSAPDPKKI